MKIKVKKAVSFKEKLFGLIGQKNITPTLFKTRFGIHTFFMTVPIDVLVLNNKSEVVKLKVNLRPWRIFFWNVNNDIVVELPRGFIKKENIRVGNKILTKKGD